MGMNEYKLPSQPVCPKESVIQGDNFRITMLTEALVRLEYSRDGVFEDRPTQSVLNRDFPTPDFRWWTERSWASIPAVWRFITTESPSRPTA